jgi:peptidoglycan hydrolase CwlO-like protein
MLPTFLHGPRAGIDSRRPRSVAAVLIALGLMAAVWTAAAVSGRAAPGGGVTLDAQRGQVRALEAELSRVDEEATAAADAHAEALRRVEELRTRIRDTGAAIVEAQAAHETAVKRLEDRLVALYVQRPPSLAEIVLSTGSLAEAVDARRTLEAVSDNDRAIIQRLEESRARLTALRAELVDGQREAEANAAQAQARLSDLESLLASRRAVLDEARNTLEAMVAQEAQRREAAAVRSRAEAIAASQRQGEAALLRRADPGAPDSSTSVAVPAASAPSTAGSPPAGDVSAALQRIAQCESGGNPQAISPSGQYRGKYQFDTGTWESYGGTGDPAAAPEAEQDRIAALLYAQRGAAPWPICGLQ